MDNVKTLKAKLIKAEKEQDRCRKAHDKAGLEHCRASTKIHNIREQIKEAAIKDKVHPVNVGEWYDYSINKDLFFKVNRQLIDGSFDLFMINIHNRMPSLTRIDMDQREFFDHCKKIDHPPVDIIINKIRSFINDVG